MVELNEKIIDVMKKIKDAIKDSDFFINRFEVGSSGIGLPMINLDIRQKEEKIENEKVSNN